MAKINAILGDLAGKLGGSVFSHNTAGSYVRAKKTPVNRNTTRQQLVRSRLSYLSSLWQSIGAGGQQQWANYGQANPHTDSFGNTIALSGQQAFIMLNARRANLGDTVPNTTPPPTENTAVPFTGTVAWAAPGTITLTGFAALPAGARIEVLAANPGSPGRNPNMHQARWAAATAAAATSPATLSSAIYGTTGQVANVWLRVTDSYGQSNAPVAARVTLT